MFTPLLELEGTSEDIKANLPDFGGRRIHVTVSSVEMSAELKSETTPRKLSISEKILERFKDVPLEEQAKVPPDLIDNLNHYI